MSTISDIKDCPKCKEEGVVVTFFDTRTCEEQESCGFCGHLFWTTLVKDPNTGRPKLTRDNKWILRSYERAGHGVLVTAFEGGARVSSLGPKSDHAAILAGLQVEAAKPETKLVLRRCLLTKVELDGTVTILLGEKPKPFNEEGGEETAEETSDLPHPAS